MNNNEDSSPFSNNKLSDISNKIDRIDALVEIARQMFDKNNSYSEIIQKLSLEMTINWTLSSGTQKEYLNAIRTKLDHSYGVKLQSKDGTNFTDTDNEIIKGKSKKIL